MKSTQRKEKKSFLPNTAFQLCSALNYCANVCHKQQKIVCFFLIYELPLHFYSINVVTIHFKAAFCVHIKGSALRVWSTLMCLKNSSKNVKLISQSTRLNKYTIRGLTDAEINNNKVKRKNSYKGCYLNNGRQWRVRSNGNWDFFLGFLWCKFRVNKNGIWSV